MNNDLKKIFGIMFIGVVGLMMFAAFLATYSLEEGEMAAVRNPDGSTSAVMEPGLHMRVPFLSTKNEYNEITTVCFDSNEGNAASLDESSYSVKFSDTYKVDMNICFRLKMSRDEDQFLELNRVAKGNYNLLRNTYKPNLTNLMSYTAAQFRGEDFMQGGQNEFLNRLTDQAKNGLLVTKRQPVEVTSQVGDAGVDVSNKQVSKGKSVVYKSVVQLDKDGQPKRVPSPLAELGIEVMQVNFTSDPTPEPELASYMTKKKERIQSRATIIEEQETEREKAITEQLRGDRERIQAKQKMLRDKDAAEINAQKRIALATAQAEQEVIERNKVAELAKIDKARELQIAKDNEGIQKANAQAAKYEAQAILEKGKANAAVTKAKYAALGANKEIYLAEVQRDISKVMYQNLQNFKVQMPQNYINGGDGSGQMQSNLDVITGFGALGMMNQAATLKQ